jgi:hypothetical protein
MINVAIPGNKLAELRKALGDAQGKIKKELATAINATSKKAKSEISKQVRDELAVTKKVIDTQISVGGKASAASLGSSVKLKKSSRIPLREFGARQTSKGVSYKVSKTQGRKTVAGAFQGPKPGVMKASWRGRVFKRVGKKRLPIVQLYGPSPWGVFVKRQQVGPTGAVIQAELAKQIDRRIRFLLLKASGKI